MQILYRKMLTMQENHPSKRGGQYFLALISVEAKIFWVPYSKVNENIEGGSSIFYKPWAGFVGGAFFILQQYLENKISRGSNTILCFINKFGFSPSGSPHLLIRQCDVRKKAVYDASIQKYDGISYTVPEKLRPKHQRKEDGPLDNSSKRYHCKLPEVTKLHKIKLAPQLLATRKLQ